MIMALNDSKYLDIQRSCVICNGNNFRVWVSEGIFKVLECSTCGLVFVNPCLNEDGLSIVYSGHHQGRMQDLDERQKRDEMYVIDREFLLETIQSGKILDIGSGGGFFLDKFPSDNWVRIGLEIDEDTIQYAKDNFDIDVSLWNSEKIPFEDNYFDVVSFRGSFEHIVNPHLVVKELKRVVKEEGYVYLCATPNVNSLCARIYRSKWNQFDAQEHIFMYSADTLKKLFEPLGFTVVKTAYLYEETPYCDLENDFETISKDYCYYKDGRQDLMGISPPFYGNMLNLIFRNFSNS
jgi:SAM-dependent methyltransferase